MAAAVKVHPLVVADMKAPPNYWDGGASVLALLKAFAQPRSRFVALPIPAFLVEHPERGPVLIDTGFDESVRTDPARSLGRAGAKVFSPIEVSAAGLVPDQLRARGIEPSAIDTIVMTHLHFDHASGMRQLGHAEFVVERREREAFDAGGLTKGYIGGHLDGLRVREVDVAGAPPDEGFDHVLDLFGDGSLRMVFTPGHTDGHCSVLLETETGPLLVAGDAAYAKRSIEHRWVPLTVAGEVRDYRASLEAIAAWIAAHPDAAVVCGHDPWDREALARDY